MAFTRSASLGVTVLSVTTGCATALSGFQPAHVPEKGHVQGEAGTDVSSPTGSVGRVVDAAETLDAVADQRELTEAEQLRIIEGAVNLAMNPPTVLPHIGAAYSPWEFWEFGVRFAASGWRLGIRRQILEQERAGVDLTVGFGFGRAAFEPPVDTVLDTIEIEDFVRWNIDVPITVGRHADWYRWWAGPRLLYSTSSQSMTLSIPFTDIREVASISGRALYFGGYAGAAFGYRVLFIGPELTLVQLFGSADVQALGAEAKVDLDSFIVYPGVAIMGEF